MSSASDTSAATNAAIPKSGSIEIENFDEILRTRRSVRGFLDKPVPPEILTEVFELAQLSPSNCNAQPWRVFVASGAARDRLSKALVNAAMSGTPPNPDFNWANKFLGHYRERQIDCAVQLYTEMDIGRDDKPGRMRAALRNFELFDAPHVAFLGMDETFGSPVAVDIGIYLQTLMLALTSRGISSCAQGSMRSYPDIIRAEFGAPDSVKILVGISFGYEDPSVPANRTRIARAALSEDIVFKD